jgi:hypothetical protein
VREAGRQANLGQRQTQEHVRAGHHDRPGGGDVAVTFPAAATTTVWQAADEGAELAEEHGQWRRKEASLPPLPFIILVLILIILIIIIIIIIIISLPIFLIPLALVERVIVVLLSVALTTDSRPGRPPCDVRAVEAAPGLAGHRVQRGAAGVASAVDDGHIGGQHSDATAGEGGRGGESERERERGRQRGNVFI